MKNCRVPALSLAVFISLALAASAACATEYGGIEFPDGESSFADYVIRYVPLFGGGPAPSHPMAINPEDALGIPDYPANGGVGTPGAVSLGNGGLIELGFYDNMLTNSGDSLPDLHIFEVGPDVEDTYVAIRPLPATAALLQSEGFTTTDSGGFYQVGKVFGSTSSIDIDTFFPGFLAGELQFEAVRLIDDPLAGNTTGPTVGADIDAVGAISSLHWGLFSDSFETR